MNALAQQLPPAPDIADLLAMPEEDRYEIMDGELVPKEEASGRHSGAQAALTGRIHLPFACRSGVHADRPGGWWFGTEALIDFGHTPVAGQMKLQIFRPDLAGWRRERLPELPAATPMTVIPNWTCEVLSPTNLRNDLVKKKRIYHLRQVTHYWIIDPLDETLVVYRWTPSGYLEVLMAQRGDTVRAEPFDAIELAVGVLFGDDD